ncbi:MAG: hypothetical protein JXA20_06860 [Spirochaetes bacterium]|nr:hypothetical protein [Spirochaetota bacterium]
MRKKHETAITVIDRDPLAAQRLVAGRTPRQISPPALRKKQLTRHRSNGRILAINGSFGNSTD